MGREGERPTEESNYVMDCLNCAEDFAILSSDLFLVKHFHSFSAPVKRGQFVVIALDYYH